MSIRVPFGGGRLIEHAWPEVLDPGDVHAGDELQLQPGSWESHQAFAVGEKLDRDVWQALDTRFRTCFVDVLCGRASPDDLRAIADPMGLTPDRRHDRRPPISLPPDGVIHDGDLADIAENLVPDLRGIAGDRVLGPFVDLKLPPRVWISAGAVLAFTRLLQPAETPLDQTLDDRPRPNVTWRACLRAIRQSPPMLWRVGDSLEPLLPLTPRFQIPGHVQIDAPAVLGRLVPSEAGPRLFACLPLPVVPDPAPILERLTWEMWRVRRHELRVTWEDMLRERGEVLYRTTLEWVFEHAASEAGTWRWPERW